MASTNKEGEDEAGVASSNGGEEGGKVGKGAGGGGTKEKQESDGEESHLFFFFKKKLRSSDALKGQNFFNITIISKSIGRICFHSYIVNAL